jgi:hypothetical protein
MEAKGSGAWLGQSPVAGLVEVSGSVKERFA